MASAGALNYGSTEPTTGGSVASLKSRDAPLAEQRFARQDYGLHLYTNQEARLDVTSPRRRPTRSSLAWQAR